jgi:uncharacterized protein (DUF362 family)
MHQVAIVKLAQPQYPEQPPYHPAEAYPEYPFQSHLNTGENNYVYAGVRQLLYQLGLDIEHWGSRDWNPLGGLIEPGMTVVLKPNFVLSSHSKGKDVYSIITHPATLRAIADFCWIALKGQGQIIIADAPQYDCNFAQLLQVTQLERVRDFYDTFAGPQVTILDLRKYWSPWKHFASLCLSQPGDPQGDLIVNLGRKSALYGKPHADKLYGAVYHRSETINHHTGECQEYQVSRTIMNADVVISVPKLKVHKKVGVTLNAKGLVGIATNKNYLVHYTLTPPREGGDQYPDDLFNPVEQVLIRTERWMYDHLLAPRVQALEYLHRLTYWLHNHTTRQLGLRVSEAKRQLDAGNWHGNDSAWRMTADLLKVFYFADRAGDLHDQPQRRMFSVIDGVVGGEGNGPLAPDPKPAGVLIGGESLVATDLVASRLMGFDPLRLPIYQSALSDPDFDFGVRQLGDIRVVCNNPDWQNCLTEHTSHYLNFRPHPGWIGHIEI